MILDEKIFRQNLSNIATEEGFNSFKDIVENLFYDEGIDSKNDNIFNMCIVMIQYFFYEEAIRDPYKEKKMNRLQLLAEKDKISAESLIFCLRFDDVKKMLKKLNDELITEDIFINHIKKYSPNITDKIKWDNIMNWADLHKNFKNINYDLLK